MQKLGNAAFEDFLKDNAKDFIFFKMDLLLEEAGNDPVKRSSMIKDIISSVARLREPIKRSLYIRQCSQSLNIEESILVKEVNKQIRNQIKQKQLEQKREERMQQIRKIREDSSAPIAGNASPSPTEPPPFEPPDLSLIHI